MTLLEVLSPVSPQRTPHSMSLPHCPSTPRPISKSWRPGAGERGVASVAQLQMLAGDPGRKGWAMSQAVQKQ